VTLNWKYTLFLFFIHVYIGQSQQRVEVSSKKGFVATGDVFGTRNFIENKDIFKNPLHPEEKVYFRYEHGGEVILFTGKGLIYQLAYKKGKMMEEDGEEDPEKEEMEREELAAKTKYIEMRWEGLQEAVVPIGMEKQSHYFTFGDETKNSWPYKKLVYKNVYPGIDFEYTLPHDKAVGIKYNVIVHPGANPQLVKMTYSGDIKKIKLNEAGQIVITAPYDNQVKEFAPVSYDEDGKPVTSLFVLNGRTLSFAFPSSINPTKKLIIDPFVSAVTTLTTNNAAFEVDYDYLGNTYIYGGLSTNVLGKEARYNSSGNLVWTFGGVLTNPTWSATTYATDFRVNRGLGKSYLIRVVGSPQLIRLDINGNYDNWSSSGTNSLVEQWHAEIGCNGEVIGLGGAYGSIAVADATTGVYSFSTQINTSNTGCCQDIISKAFDSNGESYVMITGYTTYTNQIIKLGTNYLMQWGSALAVNPFGYGTQRAGYGISGVATMCYNALAVNQSRVFYYDGNYLVAYSKVNGAVSGSIQVGNSSRSNGGVAVDDCNNVYLGGPGIIHCYSYNGTSFSSLTPIAMNSGTNNPPTYDLMFDRPTKQIFASGAGFVGSYTTAYSQTCAAVSSTANCSFGSLLITASSTSITCASLGSATANVIGGIGPFSYTWMPGGTTGSVATGLSPTTYTVFGKDLTTNLSFSNTVTFTSLIPLTGNVVSSGGVACFGAATATGAVINLAGGSGNQTYLWSNGTSTLTTATPTNISAGNWTVTVTDALTGCVLTDTFVIYQPTQLNSLIGTSSPTACVGNSINLGCNAWGASPAYTYTWSNGVNGPTTAVTSLSAGPQTYSILVKDIYQCQSIANVTLNFIPYPTLSVVSPSICPLEIGTVSVSGASTYTWSNANTTNSFTDSPNVTTIYTVTGSAQMCASTATAAIYLKPIPVPVANNNGPKCVNQNLVLNATGGISYQWDGPASYTSTNQSFAISSVSLANGGVYHVTVTAANNCTAATSTTVVINPNPTVSATAGTVCTTQTLHLSALGSAVVGFNWVGPGWTSGQQNDIRANPSTTASGQYFVVGTSSAGCTGSASANALVIPPPSLTLTLSHNDFCGQPFNGSNAQTTLTAYGASTYTLAVGSALSFINNQPSFVISAIPPYPSNNTIHQVTVTGNNGICSSTSTIQLSVKPNPVISVLNPTAYICAGESYTYFANGASIYVWQGPLVTMNGNGSSVVSKPAGTIIYTITGHHNGCASASINETLTVIPLPTLAVVPSNTEICLYSSAIMTVSGNASGYSWSPLIGIQTPIGNYNVLNPQKTQVYTVVGSVLSCTASTQATVEVLSLPNPYAVVETPSVCVGQTVHLLAGGGVSYKWSGPNKFAHDQQEVYFVPRSVIYGGDYSVTVTDAKGCSSVATVPLKVVDLPDLTPQVSMRENCVPYTTVIGSVPVSGIDVNWTFRGQKVYASSFSAVIDEAGIYTVTMQMLDVNTNCRNTHTFSIRGYAKPTADFSWLPEHPVESLDQVVFVDRSKGVVASRRWSIQEINDAKSEDSLFMYLFPLAGRYTISLAVMNNFGCGDTTVKNIDIDYDFACYIPNAFTPNLDKKNELYMPVMRGVKEFTLSIFDRWGHEMYRTSDFNGGWDGTYQGKLVAENTYVYKLVLTSNKNETKTYTGWLVLFH